MKHWFNIDALNKRIVRVASDLSSSMRIFSYSFILAILFKNGADFPLKIGTYAFDRTFVDQTARWTFYFIILDILHPLFYFLALQFVTFYRKKLNGLYVGENDTPYDPKLDKTENILEAHPCEIWLLNYVPSLLLYFKAVVTLVVVFHLFRVVLIQ